MDISIIGFGTMGKAAAGALVSAGHTVRISDPAPQTAEAAREIGAEMLEVSSDIAFSTIVLMFLPGPQQTQDVLLRSPGLLVSAEPGTVFVDHSTSDPGSAKELAKDVVGKGFSWIDAPILGRPSAVGKWALPIGQTDGALETARSAFDCYAAHVFEVGEPGAGHMIKLLNQMMFGAINAMTAEMMAISDQLGVPPKRLYDIITTSEAGTVSNLFRELGARIAEDRYDAPTFSVRLLEKDVRLGLQMAHTSGIQPKLGLQVAEYNSAAIEAGHGDKDSSVMWRSLLDGA